ncbi:ABC transporter permease [Roseivirga sp. E12]|uniref:ABC transporter permease n=1 Tax=Roseivirga sp. E12 TaxID=2819237 RepID=UPI001ABD3280|nr:ABC transporter permease [Roseivirga sp. E12]MBO3698742.1 ABC transporter permease [Roseivirga sp. E12]
MLYSYFRTAFRSLLKNKAFSFLNIIGLALGMACCMVIFQYVTFEKSYDKFHSNGDNLYRVQYNSYKDGVTIFECAAAVPAVGKAMKENFPEIEDYAIAFPADGVVSYGDVNFREERIQLATPSWLTMFDWQLIQGDIETALDGPKKMVLTESTARKYFGTEDPVGKYLKWSNSWFTEDYLITGVVKDVPNNSHIKFSILASHSTLRDISQGESETSWGWYDHNTYVSLSPGVDPKDFDKRFAAYLYDLKGEEFERNGRLQEFVLQPINDIHLKSNLLQESEPEENGDAQSVYFLGILAIFILVIAWVNYINLASAKSMERAREVGVRKVLGAYKGQLIRQFIVESIVVNFLAAIVSVGIVALVLPYFNNLTGSPLSLALIFNSGTWLIVLSVFLGGAFLSGLYPAFVLSSFRPIVVLKGKLSTSGKGVVLRKSLVTFQFLSSVFLIAGTIIVYQQMEFLKNRDLGFQMESTLVLKGPSVLQVDSLYANYLEGFKNEVTSLAAISGLSTATNVPGDEIFWTNGAKRAEAPNSDFKTIYHVGIDYEYIPNFDIEILHGRNYSREFATDENSIMLNEAATRFLGFENPEDAIGQKVTDSGQDKEVVAVLDNYNQMSLKSTIAPILYHLQPNGNSFYALRLQTNNTSRLTEQVKASWDKFFPGNPMDYFFLDNFFNRQYAKEDQFGTVFSIFSILAIIVSCLGLFGLSAFSALQRTKEIGVRKVLGASVSNILLLLSREYFLLILLAVVIGTPLTYFVMDGWLNNFAYRTDIGPLVFAISAVVVLLVALLTVSYQTIKSARMNPSNTLRYE